MGTGLSEERFVRNVSSWNIEVNSDKKNLTPCNLVSDSTSILAVVDNRPALFLPIAGR
jgi:hypothetical protein